MAERNEMMQQNQKQNIEQKYYYTVMEEQEGMRLDQFLAGELKEHSRSYIQKLLAIKKKSQAAVLKWRTMLLSVCLR